MLIIEPTPEMVEEWKAVYAEYKNRLYPNKRSSQSMIEYLQAKYPVVEEKDDRLVKIVSDNVLSNKHYSQKLSTPKNPTSIVFRVLNESTAKQLYLEQDQVFKGSPIIVGFELETGFFHIEGSSALWDELMAYRGLDEDDLENYYLVAEYINCIKKFNRLEEVLSE